MSRRFAWLIALLAVCLLAAAPAAVAEEESDPVLASEEEVAEALEKFKTDFKARGLTGDDKLSQKDWAMSLLAPVQHPDVVKALAKVTRDRNQTLRILAVIYLGEQQELPALAGEAILTTMKRNRKDVVLQMSALQSLGQLKYLGARDHIESLLKHRDYAIKKAAIAAVGSVGDMRMLPDILKLVGIEFKGVQSQTAAQNQGGETAGAAARPRSSRRATPGRARKRSSTTATRTTTSGRTPRPRPRRRPRSPRTRRRPKRRHGRTRTAPVRAARPPGAARTPAAPEPAPGTPRAGASPGRLRSSCPPS